MKFCTAINCIDGRVQLPVIQYLQKRFDAEYVDSITEPGPNKILAEGTDAALVQNILHQLRISVEKHSSVGLAVAGHYDCAANTVGREEQTVQTQNAIQFLRQHHPALLILGLWVVEHWAVHEVVS